VSYCPTKIKSYDQQTHKIEVGRQSLRKHKCMKKLPLNNSSFRFLLMSFKDWLDLLGYAPSTVRSLPNCVREFLHYLDSHGVGDIRDIDTPLISQYYNDLSRRRNERRGGGLSNNYLNMHLNALDKLLEYLRKQARIPFPVLEIKKEVPNPEPIVPLAPKDIKSLYAATQTYEDGQPHLALRDRAILALYYDCGLRCNEGVQLNLSDVHLDNRLIHVKHAKGGQQRFVPFGKATARHLISYIYDSRPVMMSEDKNGALLLSRNGKRINGLALNRRLKYMQERTDDPILKQQNMHLHLLRHSIATHLLFEGMELEKVAQFLGHRSLESTQIYTHLIEKAYESVETKVKEDG